MSIVSKTKAMFVVAANPHLISGRSQHLFLLSHMRSRSSVLSHVLGSNSNICGYAELHREYLGWMDLLRTRISLHQELGDGRRCRYFLDKLLNSHAISSRVFQTAKPKVIFLLREPIRTIKSMINMGHITGVEWYKDPEQALKYYCSRLIQLQECGKELEGNYFFIESDQLVNRTDELLTELSKWLELEEPLDKKYSVFNNTGVIGFGDPSPTIRSGVIRNTRVHENIELPLAVVQEGEAAYVACKDILLEKATAFYEEEVSC